MLFKNIHCAILQHMSIKIYWIVWSVWDGLSRKSLERIISKLFREVLNFIGNSTKSNIEIGKIIGTCLYSSKNTYKYTNKNTFEIMYKNEIRPFSIQLSDFKIKKKTIL